MLICITCESARAIANDVLALNQLKIYNQNIWHECEISNFEMLIALAAVTKILNV